MHFSEQTAKSLSKIKVELNLILTQRAEFVIHTNRSPGIDGIHPEVFLKCWSILRPPLLEMFNTAIQKGCFGRDVSTALIILLSKKDKDPTNCINYCPPIIIECRYQIIFKDTC